jgi:Ca2+-binding RTX toxin-like protein
MGKTKAKQKMAMNDLLNSNEHSTNPFLHTSSLVENSATNALIVDLNPNQNEIKVFSNLVSPWDYLYAVEEVPNPIAPNTELPAISPVEDAADTPLNTTDYSDNLLNIDMASYIQSRTDEGWAVINGTEDVDYISLNQTYTILNAEASDDILFVNYEDTIVNGGDGNDLIFGSSSSIAYDDILNGGNGNDSIYGQAGNDLIHGDEGDDNLYAGAGNDVIFGDLGNDALYANGSGDDQNQGDDIFIGGEGSDSFIFYSHTLPSYGIIKILDFTSGTDKIFLIANGEVYNQGDLIQGPGAKAQDANDFLIFDSSSGALSYDADGNGSAQSIQIATLVGVSTVSAEDFAYSF